MTFSIITLGCKVNSCESAAIHAAFVAAGYVPAEEDAPADVYIINSCAVTGVGVKKARQSVSHGALRLLSAGIPGGSGKGLLRR